MERSLDASGLEVLVNVRATIRRFVQALEQASQEAGLTEPQQHALLRVAFGEAQGEAVTATTLQQHLATDKNTVADVVRRLEAHGLLQRDRQGRRVVLTLTPAGRERFAASLDAIGRSLNQPEVGRAATRLQQELDSYLAIYQGLLVGAPEVEYQERS